jgi:hypothetical protein
MEAEGTDGSDHAERAGRMTGCSHYCLSMCLHHFQRQLFQFTGPRSTGVLLDGRQWRNRLRLPVSLFTKCRGRIPPARFQNWMLAKH